MELQGIILERSYSVMGYDFLNSFTKLFMYKNISVGTSDCVNTCRN